MAYRYFLVLQVVSQVVTGRQRFIDVVLTGQFSVSQLRMRDSTTDDIYSIGGCVQKEIFKILHKLSFHLSIFLLNSKLNYSFPSDFFSG